MEQKHFGVNAQNKVLQTLRKPCTDQFEIDKGHADCRMIQYGSP